MNNPPKREGFFFAVANCRNSFLFFRCLGTLHYNTEEQSLFYFYVYLYFYLYFWGEP